MIRRVSLSVLVWTACALLLAIPVASLGQAQGGAPGPNVPDARLGALEWRQRPGAELPLDAPLRDEHGAAATLRAASGGLPLVLAPGFFRCPSLCGVVRDDLFGALAHTGLRPGQDYAAVVLSIDPNEGAADAAAAREAVLSRYAAGAPAQGAEAGWRFLTGTAEAVSAVAGAAGFPAQYDAASRQFLHPAGILVAAPAGRVSGYLMGVGFRPEELAAEIASARDGAPRRQGPDGLAQSVLLLCGQLGIAAGRLTPAVTTVLRGVAAAAALLLAAWLWRMHRRGAA